MSSEKRLVRQYSGEHAESYDETRVSTRRFAAEEEAFAKLFAIAAPSSVLDCPVGTGRWVRFYADSGVRALGLDASSDMLARAREKAPMGSAVKLEVADLFDPTRFQALGHSFDLVVCVRFLNWIGSERLSAVLSNLDAAAGSHVLVGVGMFPGPRGSLTRALARWTLFRINLVRRLRGRWPQHVHDPATMDEAARTLGWKEVAREQIFVGKGRVSWFVLYRRGG